MNNFDLMRELASKKAGSRKHHDNEEHGIQVDCITWFRLQYPAMRHNLFAVPNGGRRSKKTAVDLKKEGVLAGVSDLILLKKNKHYGALLIEMKTSKGKQSDLQKEWQNEIEKDGYKYIVCRSLIDFMNAVKSYVADI